MCVCVDLSAVKRAVSAARADMRQMAGPEVCHNTRILYDKRGGGMVRGGVL